MDPYSILGINANASQEEIKKAFRKEAMKWHPDRNQNSSQAKDQFHRVAEAYRLLSERFSAGDKRADGRGWSRPEQGKYSGQSGSRSNSEYAENNSRDSFADSVFWDVMLEYALKLAQTGLSERDIAAGINRNGCTEALSKVIAEKAFNIHANYTSNAGRERKSGPDHTVFREERQETELLKAYIGSRSFFWSPRDTIEYYLVVFGEFNQSASLNPLTTINTNRRLMRILNFSIVLFAVIVVAISLFPGPSKYKLLSDMAMLQLPLIVLPLMFVWMLYRKLWFSTLFFSIIYVAAISLYYSWAPRMLSPDLSTLLLFAVICYTPFLLIALYANFFYYLNAQRMIRSAKQLFGNHLDQIIWIKNRAGTSSSAAFVFSLLFIMSLAYFMPDDWDYSVPVTLSLPFSGIEKDDSALQKVKDRSNNALEYFDIAESSFNSSSPDFIKAEMAYSLAADDGSLLACYQLGYMYYTGDGVDADKELAFKYFQLATRAPLAFQPHSLELTVKFLAESYNNLGIMYQSGFGTRKNLDRAARMYRQAVEFGSSGARKNLKRIYRIGSNMNKVSLVYPKYN